MTYFPKTVASGGVAVATPHPGEVRGEFYDSMCGAMLYDVTHNRRIVGPNGGFINMNSGPRLGATRSSIVNTFLTNVRFKASEWLVMIDSDMTFDGDAIDRLIETAEAREARVVGALCFGARRFDSAVFPTVYRLARDENNTVYSELAEGWPEDEPFICGGTGAAFLLMHRSLLVDMGRPHPDGFGTLPNGVLNKLAWFAEVAQGPYDIGEDITFCMRVQAMGDKVWVDPRVKTGHMKYGEITEKMWKER